MFRILFACSTSKSFSSEVKHSACEHCLAGHIYLFLYFHTCYLNDAKYHQMYNTNINLSWRKWDVFCIWTKTCDLSRKRNTDKHIYVYDIDSLM